MKDLELQIIIEPDESAFMAYVPQLPGCFSCGDTVDEAYENILEAITIHMEPIPTELLKPAESQVVRALKLHVA
jgi:predicted RNase H-like HicB family nuclease